MSGSRIPNLKKKVFDEYDVAVRLALAITVARQKAKITQKELARRIGSTQPAIARLEAGDVINPEFRTIIKIERALHPHFSFQIGVPKNLTAA